MHTYEAETSCCAPRAVYTAQGCVDGVSWLRIVQTQGPNAGVQWLNLVTNELVDTQPVGFTLGVCPAEPTGALLVEAVTAAPPATGNTGSLPRLEYIVATGEAWVIGSDGEAVQVEKVASDFSNVVYVNGTNPNTATVFDDENPPVTHDASLQADDDNLYIGTDGRTWTWSGSGYVAYSVPSSTEWFTAGTTVDAGANKTGSIYRRGAVLIATGGSSEQTPRQAFHVQAGGASGATGVSGAGALVSTDSLAGARVFLEHSVAPSGRRLVAISMANGLTRFGSILDDTGATWTVENTLVVRNNGGPIVGAIGVRTANPVSHFDVNGSFGANIEKTAAATQGMVANSHTYVSQVGNTFVTLPAPSADNIRRIYVVKRVQTADTPTTVLGHIDDVASAQLAIQPGQARTFQCDGTTWWVI